MKLFSKTMYHGTPHNFDKFDLAFMGTGEGGQAHGWGIYLAETRQTANRYRPPANELNIVTINGESFKVEDSKRMVDKLIECGVPIDPKGFSGLVAEKMFYKKLLGIPCDSWEHYAQYIQHNIDKLNENMEFSDDKSFMELRLNAYQTILDIPEHCDISIVRESNGMLATVEIPDDLVLADEWLTIGEQPDEIKNAMYEIIRENTLQTASEMNVEINDLESNIHVFDNTKFKEVYKTYAGYTDHGEKLSRKLYSLGVDGIKYWGNCDGHCMVIFNPNIIKIRSKE